MARKIEKLIYTNERGESIIFSHASVYHLNEVNGISDVRNTIYTINSAGQDGDTYLGNRIESREIEIVGSIKERDKGRMHEFRRKLIRVLNPQYAATLTYEYGDFKRVIDCKTDGALVFSRKAIFQDFTVQLLCPNSLWRRENETRDDIATWFGCFAFPVEIPHDWEIGTRKPSLIVNVYNDGDVKTGIRAEFRALGVVENPSLLNVDTQEFIKLNITLEAGDVLSVSTGCRKKKVTLKRRGIVTNAFRYMDVDSTYLQLAEGDNLFRYDAESNLENLEVSIYHNDLYLGV